MKADGGGRTLTDILTTNMGQVIDDAFVRRRRFAVDFPLAAVLGGAPEAA